MRIWILPIILVSTAGWSPADDFSDKSPFSKFYNYAFPEVISSPIYTELFDSKSFAANQYNLQDPESRREAFLAASKGLQVAEQPKFFKLDRTPNNSIFANYVFRNKERFLEYPADFREALEEVITNRGNAEPAERFLLCRDMWNILASARSFSRLHDRADRRQIRDVLNEIEKDLEENINTLSLLNQNNSNIEKELDQPFTLGSLLKLTDALPIGKDLRRATKLQNFKEVPFNPNWQHLEAFSGASMFRIFTWSDPSANPPEKGSMLVKTALLPKDAKTSRVYEKFLIEEILISGVGGEKSLIFAASPYPVHFRYAMDRSLFIERMSDAGRQTDRGYLVGQQSESEVFIGFYSDMIGVPPRGSREIQQSAISCIDCHGGIGKPFTLPLVHTLQEKPSNYTKFKLNPDGSLDIILLPFYR